MKISMRQVVANCLIAVDSYLIQHARQKVREQNGGQLVRPIPKSAKPKDLVTVSFQCTEFTAKDELIPLIKYIGQSGNRGHTFGIVVDPMNSEYKKDFEFDGDGGSYIDIDSVKLERKS